MLNAATEYLSHITVMVCPPGQIGRRPESIRHEIRTSITENQQGGVLWTTDLFEQRKSPRNWMCRSPKREKRKEELAELEQSIERVQQQQVSIQTVEQIEAKPLPLTSKVAVDREDYQNLVTAAQKYIAQEKQEGKLKKLLKEAKKTISDLKAKIQSLTAELSAVKAELAQYKSVRGKLRTADLEQENIRLRSKIRSYESTIERNDLWHIFNLHRNKTRNRDDAR